MGLTYSSVIDADRDEVFSWHTGPGAITRLIPPWQPLRVLREAGSLRDGRAILTLPGGLRWVAAHQPDGYDPPNAFADELTSLPLPWRHTHQFSPSGHTATRRPEDPAAELLDGVDAVIHHPGHRGGHPHGPGQDRHRADSERRHAAAVPGFGPRLLLGDEGAREIAQASQYVLPERLTGAGHRFRQPELTGALRHLFGREGT
jgi:ligand-binding SRPBCC domain-containing protein